MLWGGFSCNVGKFTARASATVFNLFSFIFSNDMYIYSEGRQRPTFTKHTYYECVCVCVCVYYMQLMADVVYNINWSRCWHMDDRMFSRFHVLIWFVVVLYLIQLCVWLCVHFVDLFSIFSHMHFSSTSLFGLHTNSTTLFTIWLVYL